MSDNIIQIDLFGLGVNATIQLETNWNSFSLAVLEVLGGYLFGQTDAYHTSIQLLQQLAKEQKCNIPQNINTQLSPEQCAIELLALLEYLFNNINLTRLPFDGGMSESFNDITCGEFEKTEESFNLFNDTKDEKHLVDLAESIFRGSLSFKGADYPRKLPIVFTWYLSCRKHLHEIFNNIYEGSDEQVNIDVALMAFTKMIHLGAGERNGSREDIRKMKLKEFLYDISLMIEQAEEEKNQIKNGTI